MNRSSKGRWDVYIHFEQSTMCFGLESSPRLQYKLSKVNYSPTPWGLVTHLSTYKSLRMPHVSPGWGFPVTSALRAKEDRCPKHKWFSKLPACFLLPYVQKLLFRDMYWSRPVKFRMNTVFNVKCDFRKFQKAWIIDHCKNVLMSISNRDNPV